jgi:hypothetical protein
MIIVQPNNTTYVFSIIPTSFEESYYVTIRDEQKNKMIYNDFSTQVDNISDITEVSIEVSETLFKVNNFYNISFYVADELLYRGKILVTSQSVNNYTINKDKYITPTIDNNDYITI